MYSFVYEKKKKKRVEKKIVYHIARSQALLGEKSYITGKSIVTKWYKEENHSQPTYTMTGVIHFLLT